MKRLSDLEKLNKIFRSEKETLHQKLKKAKEQKVNNIIMANFLLNHYASRNLTVSEAFNLVDNTTKDI